MCPHFVSCCFTVSCFGFYCKHLRFRLNGQKNKAGPLEELLSSPLFLVSSAAEAEDGTESRKWVKELSQGRERSEGLRWSGQVRNRWRRTADVHTENKHCAALVTGRVQTKDLAALTHTKTKQPQHNVSLQPPQPSSVWVYHDMTSSSSSSSASNPPLPLPLNVSVSNKEHTTAATVSLLLCFPGAGAVCEQHNTTQHNTTQHSTALSAV